MPTLAEIANAMIGSVLIARRDPSAPGHFDMTVGGFWRSFLAIVLVAPLYLALSSSGTGALGEVSERTVEVAPAGVRLVMLAGEWIAFPVAMAFLARLLGLQQRYAGYIIVYNWSSVPAIAVLLPPLLLHDAGLLGAQATIGLFFAVNLGVAYYRWIIARVVLDVSTATAIGVVVFDYTVSILVNMGIQQLMLAPQGG